MTFDETKRNETINMQLQYFVYRLAEVKLNMVEAALQGEPVQGGWVCGTKKNCGSSLCLDESLLAFDRCDAFAPGPGKGVVAVSR